MSRIPKAWFVPNGRGSWSVAISDKGLEDLSNNCIGCLAGSEQCFEAVVPLLCAPDMDTVAKTMQAAVERRKDRVSLMSMIFISLGILGGVIGSSAAALSMWMLPVPFLSLVILALGLKKYLIEIDDLAMVAAAFARRRRVPYGMSYRMLLQHVKQAIEGEITLVSILEDESVSDDLSHLSHVLKRSMPEDITDDVKEVLKGIRDA